MSCTNSIVTIDSHYGAPGLAAAYLIAEPGHAVFVDNNTPKALPHLRAALDAVQIDGREVEYLIVTHVHLDHGGGTAGLLEHCPNATVLCHPRAVRHLVDPSRVIASSKLVYGDEAFANLYGVVEPVSDARIRAVADGESLPLGSRVLTFLHTEGHARHHVCVHDSGSNSLFTGDALGLAMANLPVPGGVYVMCSTTPTDFDPAAARVTAQRLLETGATCAHVTHFGSIGNVPMAVEQFLDSLERMERIVGEAAATGLIGMDLLAFCHERVDATMRDHIRRYAPGQETRVHEWFSKDYWLNAMGVAHRAENG